MCTRLQPRYFLLSDVRHRLDFVIVMLVATQRRVSLMKARITLAEEPGKNLPNSPDSLLQGKCLGTYLISAEQLFTGVIERGSAWM